MGLIDDIKNQVKKSGTNKGKIVYFKPGVKTRVRFLQEMDDGMKVLFHDSFESGVNVPCQELFDRDCQYHDDEALRHRDQYIWCVWDHEAKEVKLLMGAVNNFSPIPQLVGFFDTYGTITDRDYVITKNGQGTNQTWSIVPMDKVKFRNEKAKAYSESKILSILDKAFPGEDADEEEPKKAKHKAKKRQVEEDEDEDEDEEPSCFGEFANKSKCKACDYKKKCISASDDEEDEEDEPAPKNKTKKKKESPYDDMTAKELYLECKEREIKVKPKQDEEYYIEKLEEADSDDEDEDAWS